MAFPAVFIPAIASGFTTAVTWMSAKIALDGLFKLIALAFGAFVLTTFTAFMLFMIKYTTDVYFIINDFFNLNFSGSSSSIVNQILGFADCVGLFGGLRATMDIIMAALAFRLYYFIGKKAFGGVWYAFRVFIAVMNTRAT